MKYRQQFEQGRETKFKILEAGLVLWPNATPSAIAKMIGVKHSTVLYHFPNVKEAIKQYAISVKDKRVVAMLVLVGDPLVRDKSIDLDDILK